MRKCSQIFDLATGKPIKKLQKVPNFLVIFVLLKKNRFTTAPALRGIDFAHHDAGEHPLTP